MTSWLPAAVVLLLFIIAPGWIFNRLVRHRNRVKEAWAGIDVQLKRRHDLVPNLVRVVESYAGHERTLLEELTRIRAETLAAGGRADLQRVEGHLTDSLESLLVLVENYPDLKADGNFLDLHHSLVEVEDHLQMARRYYNGSVRDMNILVEGFPSNVIARMFGFRSQEFFELESATERAAPRITFGTKGKVS